MSSVTITLGPLRCGFRTVTTHLKMEYCNPNLDDLKLLERSGPPRYELVLSRADQSLSTATSNLYSTCKKKKDGSRFSRQVPVPLHHFPCLTHVSLAVPPPNNLFLLPNGTYAISFDLPTRRIRDDLPNGWDFRSTGAYYEFSSIQFSETLTLFLT